MKYVTVTLAMKRLRTCEIVLEAEHGLVDAITADLSGEKRTGA